ncbi:MAG TPA: hypothetical protein PLD88_00530, partial [Candidatus Berkiella sp.]|nr:hypothetical protein [Candidatus Berkiella sp.]
KGSKFIGEKVGIIASDKPSPSPIPTLRLMPPETPKATVTEIEKAKKITKEDVHVRSKQPHTRRVKAKEPISSNTETEKQRKNTL